MDGSSGAGGEPGGLSGPWCALAVCAASWYLELPPVMAAMFALQGLGYAVQFTSRTAVRTYGIMAETVIPRSSIISYERAHYENTLYLALHENSHAQPA